MGTNTFQLIIDGEVKATTSIEIKDDLEFIARLERKEGYKGEFGFDWMREGLENHVKYEKLKSEYNSKPVADEEYFAPWLSMFPNQDNVSLILKIKKINDKKTRKDDLVKLQAKNGIRFDPSEVYIKDIDKNEKGEFEIKVFCDNALNEDTEIELLDKYNDVVGRIMFAKNNITYKLDIKFVKVCKKKHLKNLKERFDRHITEAEKFMINNSLNQALIKPNIVERDFNKLEFISLDDLSEDEFTGITITKKGKSFIKEKCQSVKNFKGIVIFYLSVENEEPRGGDAQLFPLDGQFVFIYLNSAALRDFPHEIGHVLGLQHSFLETSDYISKMENIIKKYNIQLNEQKAYRKQPNYNQNKVEKNISKLNQYIEDSKQDIIEYQSIIKDNPYKFPETSTTNLMDYFVGDDIYKSKDFYRWQWLIMQKDIINYYN